MQQFISCLASLVFLIGPTAVVDALDKKPPEPPAGKQYLQNHEVPFGSSETVAKIMREIYDGTTIKIEPVPPNKIAVWADAKTHAEIALLVQWRRPSGKAAVIQLNVLRASTMEALLKNKFAKPADGGPYIEADAERKAIRVRGSGEQVDQVREEIDRIEKAAGKNDGHGPPSVRFHDVPKGSAEGITKLLAKHLNDETIRITAINAERIIVYASDDKTQQAIANQVKLLADAFELWQPKQDQKKASPPPLKGPPVVNFYDVRNGTAESWATIIQKAYPEAKVQPINPTRLFVYGDPQTQLEIARIIDAGTQPLGPLVTEIIPLATLDAAKTAEALREIFRQPDNKGPSVAAHKERNALIVRGTAQQVKDVRAVIRALDDDAGKSNMRIIQVEDGHARTIAEGLQILLPRIYPNIVITKLTDPPMDDKPAKGRPSVNIVAVADRVVVRSEDRAMLDNVVELVRLILRTEVAQCDYEGLRLKHTKAADVAKVVDELYNGKKNANGERIERVHIVVDPQSNSLLLRGRDLDRIAIRNLVERTLDLPPAKK